MKPLSMCNLSFLICLHVLVARSPSFAEQVLKWPQPECSENDRKEVGDNFELSERCTNRLALLKLNGKKRFLIFNDKADWTSAYLNCQNQGQQLALLRNEGEHNDLVETLIEEGKVNHPIWIRVKYFPKTVTFNGVGKTFESLEMSGWPNWRGEPKAEPVSKTGDSLADHCVTLENTGSEHKWVAQPCNRKYIYACEYFE